MGFFFGPLVSGGLARLFAFAPWLTCVSRPRRWSPTPAVPAFGCFAQLHCCWKSDSVSRSLFLFRRSLSCPTTKGNIARCPRKTEESPQARFCLSTVARNQLQRHAIAGE